MKNKCTVVSVKGISGLLILFFLIGCAIVGFIAFPAWLCMSVWNFISNSLQLPIQQMNFFQGVLLWFIVLLSVVASNFSAFKIFNVNQRDINNSKPINNCENKEEDSILTLSPLSNKKSDSDNEVKPN